jgi:hypothetical protein
VGFAWQWLKGGPALNRQLDDIVESLDSSDPNWRLEEIERTRAKLPEADNSARVVVKAFSLLGGGGFPPKGFDEKLRGVHRAPNVRLDQARGSFLEREMRARATAVVEARRLAGMPHGRHHLRFGRNPLGTNLTEQQNTLSVAGLLRFDAMNRAQKGDVRGALESCRAALNAARSLDDDPFVTSQFIRGACVSLACNAVERVLAQGEASEADLARLQGLLDTEEKHPTLLVAIRGQRAVLDDLFTRMETGRLSTREAIPMDWRSRLLGVSQATLRRDHAQVLELLTRLADAARLPEPGQAAEVLKAEREIRSRSRDTLQIMIMLRGMDKTSTLTRRKSAQVRSLTALLAVERYRLKNGDWPEKLDDLVPALLPAVPLDPHDGKPLRYRKRGDGVVVYSVGDDRSDDGGKFDRDNPSAAGTDQGFELWDVKARRLASPAR